jgi:hypothetical protein
MKNERRRYSSFRPTPRELKFVRPTLPACAGFSGSLSHHWRIAMTSLVRNKFLDRPLFILTAGLLLQAHTAFANDSAGNAQAQARAFLDPPVVSRAMSIDGFTATQADGHVASRPDPQGQARAFLLGKPEERSVVQSAIAPNSTRDGAQSISAQDRRAHTDPQESARRMILGPGAPGIASRLAAGEQAGSSVRRLGSR